MYYLVSDSVTYWIVNKQELKHISLDGGFEVASSKDKQALRELKRVLTSNEISLNI